MVAETKAPAAPAHTVSAPAPSEEDVSDDDQEPINLTQKKHKALKKKFNQKKKKTAVKK